MEFSGLCLLCTPTPIPFLASLQLHSRTYFKLAACQRSNAAAARCSLNKQKCVRRTNVHTCRASAKWWTCVGSRCARVCVAPLRRSVTRGPGVLSASLACAATGLIPGLCGINASHVSAALISNIPVSLIAACIVEMVIVLGLVVLVVLSSCMLVCEKLNGLALHELS